MGVRRDLNFSFFSFFSSILDWINFKCELTGRKREGVFLPPNPYISMPWLYGGERRKKIGENGKSEVGFRMIYDVNHVFSSCIGYWFDKLCIGEREEGEGRGGGSIPSIHLVRSMYIHIHTQ